MRGIRALIPTRFRYDLPRQASCVLLDSSNAECSRLRGVPAMVIPQEKGVHVYLVPYRMYAPPTLSVSATRILKATLHGAKA